MFDPNKFDSDEDFEDIIERRHHRNMDITKIIYIAAAVILLLIFISCCCRKRNRGRILTPAPTSNPPVPPGPNVAPYPQQQYAAPYPVQVVTAYPVTNAAAMPAPYPSHPAPYPAYPAANMPLPEQAPYPGYPQASGYPSAPSAPDANVFFGIAAPGWNPQAMPPTYEQAVCAKPPPHNPYASH